MYGKLIDGKLAYSGQVLYTETEQIFNATEDMWLAHGWKPVYWDSVEDIENQYVDKEGVRFFDYVSQEFGAQTAENLRNIKQTITIEKYAPVHLKHTFEELHNEFRVILNKIA